MKITARKVVTQYVFVASEMGVPTFYGRIVKDDNAERPYTWEISHHYRPNENAGGVYYPSTVSCSTAEEAETHLMVYAKKFSNIDVTKNEDY